ncbi:MAG: DUF4202 domain-containing protein [Candidatus Omnitrophica bacterium]|nr:DUF4202 domain-containing protein [Candidatus Omnitrophota bacterium]
MPIGDARFKKAIELIDRENARDPNLEHADGKPEPKELLYSKRLTEIVKEICAAPSEDLLVAIRGQHICRWMIPRSDFSMDRKGYLAWREKLKKFHAEKVGGILKEAGYGPEFIERVAALITKRNYPQDEESRALEDAVTLYFLKYQFAGFLKEQGNEKTVAIVKKVWRKLTPEGQKRALSLPLGSDERELIKKAIHE